MEEQAVTRTRLTGEEELLWCFWCPGHRAAVDDDLTAVGDLVANRTVVVDSVDSDRSLRVRIEHQAFRQGVCEGLHQPLVTRCEDDVEGDVVALVDCYLVGELVAVDCEHLS